LGRWSLGHLLSLVGVFHYLPDDKKPYQLLQQLVDALAPGSYLIFSHCTPDFAPEMWERAIQVYKADGGDAQVRNREEVARFFARPRDGRAHVSAGLRPRLLGERR
jgi:O-methyltransferase involved in polyketide biosynthesis